MGLQRLGLGMPLFFTQIGLGNAIFIDVYKKMGLNYNV
jgi:hypothetical protein